jgi:transcriptional regulator with XRE-family HTH domain
MQTFRNRPTDVGRHRARELGQRYGRELRAMRVASGLSQRELARRAGISQGLLSRIERGLSIPSLDVAARLAAAMGGRLGFALYPGDGIGLRDSGQLQIAELIRAAVNPRSRVRLETPINPTRDRRAADMTVDLNAEVAMFEIERGLFDFQAQLRSGQLKRDALAARLGRPVRLVLVIADTHRNRRIVAQHAEIVRTALPLSSRQVWAALRAGAALGDDGLLWVRERDARRLRADVTERARVGSCAG